MKAWQQFFGTTGTVGTGLGGGEGANVTSPKRGGTRILSGVAPPPSLGGVCCLSSPPSGGAACPLSCVAWCCLASSFFGWFGFSTIFCCVVLLGLLLFSVGCFSPLFCLVVAWPSPPLGGVAFPISFLRGAAFLRLLGVALFFSLSSVGWYLPLALSAWGSGKSDVNPNATQEDQPDPKKRRSDHPTPRSKGKSQDQEGRATPTPSRKVNPNPSLLKCGSPLGWCCFPPLLLFGVALSFVMDRGSGTNREGRPSQRWPEKEGQPEDQGRSRNKGSDLSKEKKEKPEKNKNK